MREDNLTGLVKDIVEDVIKSKDKQLGAWIKKAVQTETTRLSRNYRDWINFAVEVELEKRWATEHAKSNLAKAYNPWDGYDDAVLKAAFRLFLEGRAEEHGRSVKAIECRLAYLGCYKDKRKL
ncbi:MAG: hypothetical protein PF440_11955 [Thiomicrorhabdus sp.]|jgi:hypothetical protein|nr:hypothetical protein [Thiomicrorhabdus sp.]